MCIRDRTNTYELQGKTLGLVGCGRIGRMLATIAKCGFGMNVIGYDPFLKQEQLGDLITLVESQDEVFKQADFVSLHTPLTPETEHSIGMREFKLMKPTASFINASRGEVVNEAELIPVSYTHLHPPHPLLQIRTQPSF